MNRPRLIWLGFGLCMAILFGATGWMTWTALQLEQDQRQIRQAEAIEEKLRLSLWRMDSLMSPFIAQEAARPYFNYSAFHASNPNTPTTSESKNKLYNPSPLLTENVTNVLLHFQFALATPVTSPESPDLALINHPDWNLPPTNRLALMAHRLSIFRNLIDSSTSGKSHFSNRQNLFNQLPPAGDREEFYAGNTPSPSTQSPSQTSQKLQAQYVMNNQELQNRSQNISQAATAFVNNANTFNNGNPQVKSAESVKQGTMQPVWIGDNLLLARQIKINGVEHIQGCWVDWPALSNTLIHCVADLWPSHPLQLLPFTETDPKGHNLASIPVQLVPSTKTTANETAITPIRLLLCVAWAGMILATLSAGILLQGVLNLSERRAMFVSAVTHELRTPLTTFKLYSEMLAEGMVRDDATRAQYLKTLCSEANRLGHLIENVLSYSRLERGSARAQIETVLFGDLLNRILPRLEERAAQTGLKLLTDSDPAALAQPLRIDTTTVEQVLFNLVDNACKYASGREPHLLHLESDFSDKKHLKIRIRDHGPGLSEEARKRLFQPFGRSAQKAANGPPGVGLGLALSQRLSRSLGGSLKLICSDASGTVFEVTLPLKNKR